MNIIRANSFKRDYKKLPAEIQEQADNKLRFLIQNIAHPSLRVKRVQKYNDIFEASVTMKYRFFFRIRTDAYILLRIGKHDILEKR